MKKSKTSRPLATPSEEQQTSSLPIAGDRLNKVPVGRESPTDERAYNRAVSEGKWEAVYAWHEHLNWRACMLNVNLCVQRLLSSGMRLT